MSARTRLRNLGAPLSIRAFRQLWWAQLASELGDAAGRIALAVLVTDRSGTPVAAGAVLAVSVLPYLGLGQWLTARCERFSRRHVLIVADIVRAACYLGMAVEMPLWGRFALLFVASTASPPFEAVRNALIPATLPAERLIDGIALQVLTNETTRLVGLVAGGVVATLTSPAAALAINALTFLVSAVMIARIGPDTDLPPDELRAAVRVTDGWQALRNDPLATRVVWMSTLLVAFGAVPEALVVPYSDEVLHRTGAAAGVLAALVSGTILVLGPLLPRHSRPRALVRQAAAVAIVGAGVSAALFALPANAAVAGVAFAAIGPVFVGRINLGAALTVRLDDHVRASAFSLVDGFISVGQVVAGLAGGLAADRFGTRPTFVAAMAATCVAAAAAYGLPLRAEHRVRAVARG